MPVTRRTVKGVDYRVFDAAAGAYVATYGPGDDTPPDTTIGTATVSGDSATVSFSSNESGAQLRVPPRRRAVRRRATARRISPACPTARTR